jgi:hypothetical protein
MKVGGLRIWALCQEGGWNLLRAGRYGREFGSWSADRIPNYLD